jgi:hypothetical protein
MNDEDLRESFDLMTEESQRLLVAKYYEKLENPESQEYFLSVFGVRIVELLIAEGHPLVAGQA